MSLSIDEREREGVKILDLHGRLTVGPPAGQLREKITALQAAGFIRIVLNLAEVDYIDSTGLGTLVICFTSLEKAKGNLRLCNLNRRNLELLVLTKLSTVFALYNDEQDAVNSFFPNREIKHFDILSFVQQQQDE
ncbi:MAG: STAS domain-containing protein [Acidobacteria bacterium]|nr:STAS domain-containing protein [Acidobacteriota bacterium]